MDEWELDEINNLGADDLAIIDEYFDEMELPDEEKDKRKDFAKKFAKTMLLIFAIIKVMQGYEYIRMEYIINRLSGRYRDILSQYMDIDQYLDDYVNDFSNNTIETTLSNIEDDFFLSHDRALLIGLNEANTTMNYNQYLVSIQSGKKYKKWITEKDKRVRKTHKAIDDKTISITGLFKVGNTLMRFPHDTLYGIDYKELSNCRCTVSYL